MSADDDRVLDPDRVATRGFATSFRGFDQQEVRSFLEELARSLRSQKSETSGLAAVSPKLEALTSERDDLASRIKELEERLVAGAIELEQATSIAVAQSVAPAPAPAPIELDEAAMTDLLGKETVRVLDTAREAAKAVTARAQEEADRRLEEVTQREMAVEAELERRRTEFEEAASKLRKASEDEAKRLTDEAAAKAEKLVADAMAEADQARRAAEDEASSTRSRAEEDTNRLRREVDAEVLALRSEAEEAANSLRAAAEADASSAQDDAREHARQMLNEAQAVREKVFADLVKRRRVGRQQLDQVKAARDRLARSLAVVRKDLDEAMSELVTAVPDARAAMEAVGRRVPESVDVRQAAKLAVELDSARSSGIPIPGMAEDDAGEELPDIDELFARIKTGDPVDDRRTTASSATSAHADSGTKGSKANPPKSNPPKNQGLAGAPVAPVRDGVIKGATATVVSPTAPVVATAVAASSIAATSASPSEPDAASTEPEEDAGPDLPQVFIDRDVSMTRYGADLRRQMKRALADDQSQLLDALRRAKRISAKDLPEADAQRARYLDAVRDTLKNAATDGARSAGGTCPADVVEDLVEAVAGDLIEPLRQKVERVIQDADGEKEDALEPIRALYRDARSSLLPDLSDDGLAEAFARGHYAALPDGAAVLWVGDPRSEPGPDCFDNTLAGTLTKPEEFPTGHVMPPGSPGCRCLVIAADGVE